ncbi:hypothetical protein [Pseudomonas putida]|uniref:hypothetical protein n=1 Tax=Pseudomonas putida TaxID=303 RepID=UPI0039DF4A45
MGSRSTVIQVSLLAAAVAFLVGCSSTQSPKTVQLPEPKDVPKEKWSDAMHVLTAMGVSGQRDVPIEMVGGVDRVSPTKSSVAGLGDAGLSAIGYVSPPSGMSGGAAAGVGLGLMLLGGSSDPARATQVVAWVPSDQAGSPEEASALALQKVEEARRKSFSGGLSKLGMQTGRYPDGHFALVRNASRYLCGTSYPIRGYTRCVTKLLGVASQLRADIYPAQPVHA